jgi:hypothetical protein
MLKLTARLVALQLVEYLQVAGLFLLLLFEYLQVVGLFLLLLLSALWLHHAMGTVVLYEISDCR